MEYDFDSLSDAEKRAVMAFHQYRTSARGKKFFKDKFGTDKAIEIADSINGENEQHGLGEVSSQVAANIIVKKYRR